MTLSFAAHARRKAERRDKGTMSEFPPSALWTFAVVYGLLAAVGWGLKDSGLWIVLLVFAIPAAEFALMAILKWERDRYFDALDVIDKLDLRRPPTE